MSRKDELVANLETVFHAWEELLAGKSEAEITARPEPEEWAIRDVIVHLHAWQEISIARLEAALRDTQPHYPAWLGGADPFFAEEHVNDFNARIQETHHGQSWASVHHEWREGFLRFLELAGAIPGATMFDAKRHAWLRGYALSSVLEGSWEHHQEHLAELETRN